MSAARYPDAGSASPSASSKAGQASSSRYEMLVKIASGGMATVYVGRIRGAVGFWRLCAIKRAHPHLLEDPSFKQMLIEEARLASRIHHPNVVAVQDVEELAGELRLVMDYVEGASLADLLFAGTSEGRLLPARIAVRIALDACAGLLAAHELHDEHGAPLHIVHRDVSPQNILVGVDGVARLSDFGIAKNDRSGIATTTGALKGKVGYMSPEYIETGVFDVRGDVFAMGVVIWEALANKKLFRGATEVETLRKIVDCQVPTLSEVAPWVGGRLDAVVEAALAKSPDERFQTAGALATALETAARKDDLIATHAEVAAHVKALWGDRLEARRAEVRERVAKIEAGQSGEIAAGFAEETPAARGAPGSDSGSSARLAQDRAASGESAASTATITPGLSRAVAGSPGGQRGSGWLIAACIASVVGGGLLAYFTLRSPRGAPAGPAGDFSAAPVTFEPPQKGPDPAALSPSSSSSPTSPLIPSSSPSGASPMVAAASAEPIASASPSNSAKSGRPAAGPTKSGSAPPTRATGSPNAGGSDNETIAPNPYQKPPPAP